MKNEKCTFEKCQAPGIKSGDNKGWPFSLCQKHYDEMTPLLNNNKVKVKTPMRTTKERRYGT